MAAKMAVYYKNIYENIRFSLRPANTRDLHAKC